MRGSSRRPRAAGTEKYCFFLEIWSRKYWRETDEIWSRVAVEPAGRQGGHPGPDLNSTRKCDGLTGAFAGVVDLSAGAGRSRQPGAAVTQKVSLSV